MGCSYENPLIKAQVCLIYLGLTENMTTHQFAQLVRLQLNNRGNAAFQITPSSLFGYA